MTEQLLPPHVPEWCELGGAGGGREIPPSELSEITDHRIALSQTV